MARSRKSSRASNASTEKITIPKSIVPHLVITLILTAMSIWNVHHILYDYFYDNVNTIVKVETANGSFLFLENVTARVCLMYPNDTVFKDLWTNRSLRKTMPDTTAYIEAGKKTERLFEAAESGALNMTEIPLHDLLSASIFLGRLKEIDDTYAYCAITPKVDVADCDSVDIDFSDRLLHEIPRYTEQMEADIWKYIRPNLVRAVSYTDMEELQGPAHMSLAFLNPTSACFDIRLWEFVSPIPHTLVYIGGIFGDCESKMLKNNQMVVKMTLGLTGTPLQEVSIGHRGYAEVIVNANNIGVYDKSETTDCSHEPQLTFRMPITNQCIGRQYLKSVVENCHCIPFTYRNELRQIQDLSAYWNISICSQEMYKGCWKSVASVMASLDHTSCLPPCVTIKNRYTVSVKQKHTDTGDPLHYPSRSEDGNNTSWNKCSRFGLELKCNDYTYAVYEENFATTLSQLWSQIGGDVGLYTGISLLGIWQFCVLVYKIYKHRKKVAKERAKGKKTLAVVLEHYFEVDPKSKHDTDTEMILNNDDIDDVDIRVKELEITTHMIEKNLQDMKQEMAEHRAQVDEVLKILTMIERNLNIDSIDEEKL